MEITKGCRTEIIQEDFVPDCLKLQISTSEDIRKCILNAKSFFRLRKAIQLHPHTRNPARTVIH